MGDWSLSSKPWSNLALSFYAFPLISVIAGNILNRTAPKEESHFIPHRV